MFTAVDIFFILVILIFSLMALAKGFVNELFGKVSVVAGLVCAFIFFGKLAPYVQEYVKHTVLAKVLAFLMIFIVVYLTIKIIQHFVAKAFSTEIMHGLDKALGMLLGFVEGLAIVACIIILMKAQPWINFSTLLRGSFFVKLLSTVISTPINSVQGLFA